MRIGKSFLRVVIIVFAFLVLGEIEVRALRPTFTFARRSKLLHDIWPDMFADDDILPYVIRPGRFRVYDEINGINTMVSINSQGYRGPEFPPTNEADKERILFVGDSVVFGFGIADHQTLPAVLERILQKRVSPDIQVINAGFKGYTSLSNYVYLRHSGVALKPGLVLLGILPDNDLSDISLHKIELRDESARALRVSDKFRTIDGYRVSRYFNRWIFNPPVLKHSQLYYFLVTRWIDPLLDRLFGARETRQNPERQFREWSEYVYDIKELCEKNSLPLVAVVLGCKDFLRGKCAKEHEAMTGKLKEFDISFVDITPYLRSLREEDICFPYDGHLNHVGIEKSAQYLASCLIDDDLLPPSFKR